MAIGSAPEIGKEFITGGKIYYPWIEGDVQHQLMWGDSKVVYICGRPENVYSKFEWQCHKGCCGHDQGEPVNDPEDDLVESLLNMGELINQSQGVANVTMLSGDIFHEAADEIERLRQELDAISLALDECKADNERSLGKVEDLQTILTKELPIILVGEDGEQYVLRRNS